MEAQRPVGRFPQSHTSEMTEGWTKVVIAEVVRSG